MRSRVVLTNRCPTGLNRGFGGPQLYFALERTMAIAARRLGLDPAELARRNLVRADEMPYRAPPAAVYDSGDYGACLDDVLASPATTSCAAEQARRARRGAAARRSASPASSSRPSRTWATSRSPRRPRSGRGPAQVRQRRGRVDRDRAARRRSRVRIATTPQGQGHRTVVRAGRRRRARRRAGGGRRAHRRRHRRRTRGRSRRATTRHASPASAPGAVHRAASGWPRGCGRSPPTAGVRPGRHRAPRRQGLRRRTTRTSASRSGGSPAPRTGTPRHCPPASSPGCRRPRSTRRPTSTRRTPTTASTPRRHTGSSSTSAVVEVDRRTGEVRVLDYVTVHDAGRILNPLIVDGQVRGGFAHGAGAALLERHRLRRGRQPADRHLHGLPLPDGAGPAAARARRHRETPSPFTPLGAKGLGEGNTMSAPAAIANAVADALGRDDVELPLTPPGSGSCFRGGGDMKPAPFEYARPASLDEAARPAGRARRRRKGARRRAEPRPAPQHAPVPSGGPGRHQSC